MGRFKAKKVTIREFEDIVIVFQNGDTIWMLPRRSTPNVIFHRWFAPRGSYAKWHGFRKRLYEANHADLGYCHRMADRFGIQSQATLRNPTVAGIEINAKARNNC